MKIQKMVFFTLIFLASAIKVNAQGTELLLSGVVGNFFISVIAGILLAFAFQFLLTNLAVALGISAIGDIRKKAGSSDSSSGSSSSSKSSDSFTGVKISSGFGAFLLITMSISLFFASLIAVKLSLLPGNTMGFTLGLVIWAGYLLLGIYIDSKMISSLTGAVFSSVKSVLGTGASAIGDVFQKSETARMKETAKATVKSIHDEVRQEYDLSDFSKKMDEYVSKLEPQRIDIDLLQDKLAELIHEIEVKEQYTPDDPEALKRIFLEVADKQSGLSAKDKQKLTDSFDQVKAAMKTEGSKTDKAKAAADKLTPGDEAQGREYRRKVAEYLRNTNREEIQPEKLEADLEEILNNPKGAPQVVQARVSQLDRATLKSMLTSFDGMDDQKAEKYLSKAESVIQKIKSKAGGAQGATSAGSEQLKADTQAQKEEKKAKAEHAVKEWFNQMNREELQYDKIKHDVELIMDDPKVAPQVLRHRLDRMDRESLISLISNNRKISRGQAEKMVVKVEEARDNVVQKSKEIERKVTEKAEAAKQEALRQAEGARKTAAAAAWWIFIAAVVSGGLSAIGGMLAYTF